MNLSDAFLAQWNAHANPIDAAQAVRLLHRAHHLLKNIGMAKNHATRLMESERDGSTTIHHIKAAITAASMIEKPGEIIPVAPVQEPVKQERSAMTEPVTEKGDDPAKSED